MRQLFIIGLGLCALSIACGSPSVKRPAEPYAEVTVEVREQVVRDVLSKRPKVVLLYARGLCCPSCGIGVRKAVSRLSFVDRSKANQGVQLDAKHQLVEISVLEGKTVTASALWQAIMDAGYDPVSIFTQTSDGLKTEYYKGPLP